MQAAAVILLMLKAGYNEAERCGYGVKKER
jgi:hypothetical protein